MKNILTHVFENKILTKCILSQSTNKNVLRATGRLTQIKDKVYFALETFYADGKARQRNLELTQSVEYLADLLPTNFRQLNLFCTTGEAEIRFTKKGKMLVSDKIKRDKVVSAELTHNRKKKYIIDDEKPVDFLIALGVQDELGRIFDKKRSKFRQINRFLEIVADVEKDIVAGDDLYILDLCCGKSYLSFALYYYFAKIKNIAVTMDCVDLKKDVIDFCNEISAKLDYKGLHFYADDIRNFTIKRTPDLTVSLHACDIATDIVLQKGIASGSRVIMSTPCCHHEMMGQLKMSNQWTDVLLEHSILKQKFTDALTDSLRCKFLEMNGYTVNALELIDPEETPKNVMIRAIKNTRVSQQKIEQVTEQYKQICLLLGIEPYLWKNK